MNVVSCVHLWALMNRLCGSSVRKLCWRSRTSSWDLSSLSASWHTLFHPASSFLRLPLDSSLQHKQYSELSQCVYFKSVSGLRRTQNSIQNRLCCSSPFVESESWIARGRVWRKCLTLCWIILIIDSGVPTKKLWLNCQWRQQYAFKLLNGRGCFRLYKDPK